MLTYTLATDPDARTSRGERENAFLGCLTAAHGARAAGSHLQNVQNIVLASQPCTDSVRIYMIPEAYQPPKLIKRLKPHD